MGDALRSGPVRHRRRGDERQPAIGDMIDERPRQAVHEHVVTEIAHRGAEVDRVDLAAADRQVVGVDDDPHLTAPIGARRAADRMKRAGLPAQTSPGGTSLSTTAPMPTTEPTPTTSRSRMHAPEPT